MKRTDPMLALRERQYDAALADLRAANERIQRASANDDLKALERAFESAAAEVDRCKGNLEAHERESGLSGPGRDLSALQTHVGGEPLVYSRVDEGNSFFADAFHMQVNGDFAARERLERHGRQNLDQMREKGVQLRDVGTSAFAGLTIPQYLIDEFAELSRAGSPTLNLIAQKRILPESGMTLNIGRMTTGTAVAAQVNENDAVQETNADDTLLTIDVRTYAGQQDVSRQALERSEAVDVEIFNDLVADYFRKVNDAIINADGTAGTHLGIRATTGIVAVSYTDASPTVPEFYPKLADAIRQINAGVFAKATAIVMHSRRWGWGTAALDSNNRPLFLPDSNGPFNALAVGQAAGYGQVMGRLQALPVITDDSIPTNLGAGTNEDIVLVVSGGNLRFWAETADLMPRRLRFEQVNAPQSIRLAVWGYSAFTAGKYPGASATIAGTGLVAPTF